MKSLYFIVNSEKSQSNISIRYTDSMGKCVVLATPYYILPTEWYIELERPFKIYERHYAALYKKLTLLKIELGEALRKRQKQQKEITVNWLHTKIALLCNRRENYYMRKDILYYIHHYIDQRKEFIEHSTYKRYKVFYELFYRFSGYCQRRILLNDLDQSIIEAFYVFGRKGEYSESTLHKSLSFLKGVIQYFHKKGMLKKTVFIELYPLRKRETIIKNVVTFNENELNHIYHTKVPQYMVKAKEWLLISCYSGQRVSDFLDFNSRMLRTIDGKQCIEFVQHKTHKRILLPLHPIILEILEKYNGNFPPKMGAKAYNYAVKKITRIANIKEKVEGKKMNNHRKKIGIYEKWELISSHIGRRSFASNFFGKIPTPLIMQATGHSTEAMFLEYVSHNNHGNISLLNQYFENTYSQSTNFFDYML